MTLNNTNAKLTIHSTQVVMGEEQSSLSNEEAFYTKKGDKYYVLYHERDENGHAENKVQLIIAKDGVTVTRSGAVSARLVYHINEKTETNYRLVYGILNVEVFTRKIEFSENPDGFYLEMDYDISIGEEKLKTCLKITVEKKEQ